MGEDPSNKTETLNTAEFRDKRDASMLRSHKLGNSMLRMIPEVRDHGDKLVEEIEGKIEEIEEEPVPSPPPPPRPNASHAIAMLRATASDMTEDELAQVRELIGANIPKVKSPPLVLVLFVGIVIGAIIGVLVCTSQRALKRSPAYSTEAPGVTETK